MNFIVWDVGGRGNMKALWRHYYPGTNGLVFILDSNDRERLESDVKPLIKYLLD